jgi:uncharacterized protein (TIGR00255 family)
MSAPIRSMNGFARVRKATSYGEITVGLKSVNHRGLDLHFHLESELNPFEGAMRAAMKRAVVRGHVDVRCSIVSSGNGAGGGLNVPLFHTYLAAFRNAAAQEGLSTQPDLNQAFRIPGMFGAPAEVELDSALEGAILPVLEEAAEILNQFRAREGAELARVIREQNRLIRDGSEEMEQIRSQAIPAFQSRLLEKLRELLGSSGIDPQRIAQEAAFLAERGDISEEIARLKIHSRQLDEILDAGGEAGKKLDFLLQEMNRETNTILSKTSGIGELGLRITDLALAFKAAIEKIREQALNLE